MGRVKDLYILLQSFPTDVREKYIGIFYKTNPKIHLTNQEDIKVYKKEFGVFYDLFFIVN